MKKIKKNKVKNKTTVYRIRRRSDELFSEGGIHPRFSLNGRVWRRKEGVCDHIHLIRSLSDERPEQYVTVAYDETCDVVTYELTETEVDASPTTDFFPRP